MYFSLYQAELNNFESRNCFDAHNIFNNTFVKRKIIINKQVEFVNITSPDITGRYFLSINIKVSALK